MLPFWIICAVVLPVLALVFYSALRTITWKSAPDWHETGLIQPTPWDGQRCSSW